jgi:catalase
MQSVIWDEAVKINGADSDFHRRDLFEAIATGDFPEWEFGVQLFDEHQAASFDFDVLDATKLVPEELVPLKIVGWCSTATRIISFPRLSKSRFVRQKKHISALVFELSKVETPAIRERVVSHLVHVDAGMAKRVAAGLWLRGGIEPAPTTVPAGHQMDSRPPSA